ncbi:MAG: ATP-binding protein [Desulfobacterales bacterium]|nr:ATP-binding protein [Desulfobacterales bacterium]
MGILKPKFWDYYDVAAGPYKHLFNFRRIWKWAVLLTAGVALLPLIFITLIDYDFTQRAIESEIMLRTSRLVSNTRRSISFFLAERKSALDFIDHDNTLEKLNDQIRLGEVMVNLKNAFGGFVDLGVIDSSGTQRTYVGPYKLKGKDYSDQDWFREVVTRGVYISDVFLGFRRVPHLVIAVKHALPNGSFYVLRATLDTDKFNDLLSNLELSGLGDVFIINHEGILQTPSHSHGGVLENISLPIPEYAPVTQVFEGRSTNGAPLVIGYRYIANTPFILMIVKQKRELMKPWHKTRLELLGFLVVSITIILGVILGGATYLVNRVYLADQRRIMTLHEVEYSNKMASIGRLASGVAHEINNPLAIINEKAGLIKDLITFKKNSTKDPKLICLVDSVLSSVERCGRITKRLLGFVRHMEVSVQPIKLDEIIHDVLGFLDKEAEYRSIAISVEIPNDIPQLESDRGKLQQIFLNVINNAFAAMSDGGHLDITARREDKDFVSATITDNGYGIPEEDLERVFEPFFSTKTKKGGTGLGLSITYGLIQDIGGRISVQSEEGKGTSFIITLPLKMEQKEGSET